jgi:inositol-1,4,5-trisphosphate 5-phosphatase
MLMDAIDNDYSFNLQLLKLDNELEKFKDRVFEFDIAFPPSYPFTEDACGTTYMKTRCPAWCDRILLSHSAKDIIQSVRKQTIA